MRKLLATAIMLCSTPSSAQVGIETASPKGIFHIDGNKDNPKNSTTTISPTQQANDFIVVQNSGQVGIGTASPTTALEINNGTSNGAIKIVDGNQGAGKYLMSNATGLATWRTPNSFKSAIVWNYNGTAQTVHSTLTDPNVVFTENQQGRVYTNLSLVGLTTGKWIVNMGVKLKTAVPLSKAFWMHGNVSTSTTKRDITGWNYVGPAGNSAGYAGVVFGNGDLKTGQGFLAGTSIIQVTSTTPLTLYLLLEDAGQWSFDTSSPENYFYAIPIN